MTQLSVQQVVDCDHNGDYGCDGSDPPNAYKYIIECGGLEAAADYGYHAVDGHCRFNKSLVYVMFTFT